jgi:hypothetical protein
MKHLKTYETLFVRDELFKEGMWVLINNCIEIQTRRSTGIGFRDIDKEFQMWLMSTPGQIIDMMSQDYFTVKYDKVPEKFIESKYSNIKEDRITNIKRDYIQVWSDTREEIEIYLASKKYNL